MRSMRSGVEKSNLRCRTGVLFRDLSAIVLLLLVVILKAMP